jgi:hypothetical protein
MQASTRSRNKPLRQGDPFAHNQPNGWPCGAQLRELSLKAKRLVDVGRKTPSISSAQCPRSGEP